MNELFAAVDIGTTTVEISVINNLGERLIKNGFLNPQKKYGSDVISRITNSVKEGFLDNMTKDIRLAIKEELEGLLKKLGDFCLSDILKMTVSANVVMASLFLGLDISAMGKYPFPMPFHENVTCDFYGIPCTVLSGSAAFFGADVISGALFLGLSDREILMDLGTNGEILVKNGNEYHSTTASCGPAFENCTRASKIYGSTTLGAIAYMLKRRMISSDLTFSDEFLLNGMDINLKGNSIHVTHKIIREIQLAVSALYSSLELVLSDSGLLLNDVSKLYIAGGFGFYMSIADAIYLGLVPGSLSDKIVICNNTSLFGAEQLSLSKDLTGFDNIRRSIINHQYAGDMRYEQLYIDNLILRKRG